MISPLKKSAVAFLIAVGFSILPSLAVALETDAIQTPEALFKELNERVDALEQQDSRNQAECFKIRILAEKLFKAGFSDDYDFDVPRSNTKFVPGDGFYSACETLSDEQLISELNEITGRQQTSVGYQGAQTVIFSKLDNENGEVECVYTGKRIKTEGEPSAAIMNVEHTWPQSQGAVGIAKADLHHLFPADSRANGIRGNLPFGIVDNSEWEEGGSKCNGSVFEVRSQHRGNVARAKFYFAVRYSKKIAPEEEKVLRGWNAQDPVDDNERKRNDSIENLQHNRNPFIDKPEFVERIADF